MYTKAGLDNLKRETFGTLEEYTTALHHYLNVEFAEDKEGLASLIFQAHAKGIPTMDLVKIIKSSML